MAALRETPSGFFSFSDIEYSPSQKKGSSVYLTLAGRDREIALIKRLSRRRVQQLWQAYRQTGIVPTLKKPGRPSLRDATLILEAYDKVKVNALTLERVLKHTHGFSQPHNRIHMILKENGRAMPQLGEQKRRRWVRYEHEHSMSVWHMDWKQLRDGRWWIAVTDEASADATAEKATEHS